ncbi:MAG: hypothetical protein AAGG38_00160 [Planctomycetota bacterium]
MLFGLITPPTHADDPADSPAAELAERYGLSGWGQVDSLTFTFNVVLPGRDATITRAWTWDVVGQSVTRQLGEETHRVNLKLFQPVAGLSSNLKDYEVHEQFINDTYWLLFPFQLVWSNPTVTEQRVSDYPIVLPDEHHVPAEGIRKLVCQWPAAGGYTPGDAYDLYLGPDGFIKQWVFRRGGKAEGSAHTWEDHQQLGPIVVSLDHHNAAGTFRLWFTGVQATLNDGTAVTPQPKDAP